MAFGKEINKLMLASIVIRTLNEARHLPALLDAIQRQNAPLCNIETILVDSGSTDGTIEIAERFGCVIKKIGKKDFTFGRSLNVGCEAARGEILVFISGHCIPCENGWLAKLIAPIAAGAVAYTYGRQVGNEDSKFSECQLFKKYFPDVSKIPQEGFFVNNANSALSRAIWERYRFDEGLTGLEDMEMGKRLIAAGFQVGYCADATVFHLHEENWRQIKRRYEREALALQRIMPEVHLSLADFLRFFFSSILLDFGAALQEKKLHRVFFQTMIFRFLQFWGAYIGNQNHRVLSREAKYRYFYPK